MDSYIQISKINDFIFCPYSLYLHSIYDNFNSKTYHQSPQVKGKIAHESIDIGKYSTSKKYLIGIDVYSSEYNLAGKIDVYDNEKYALIERKNLIKNIYDGYKYQLYAQCFCMQEMGFHVNKLYLHSLQDNKRYEINMPNKEEKDYFKALIEEIKSFNFNKEIVKNESKCMQCIYKPLCFY